MQDAAEIELAEADAGWIDALSQIIAGAQTVFSSYILLPVLLLVGLYLTIGLKFMPIRRIPRGFAELAKINRTKDDEGDVSPFGALMTALSATIGTGNIGGVALALYWGGPGALFWMWVTALVGMASKYAEAVLAVKYREVDEAGRHVGGPMYYIRNGLGKNWGWLAFLFALMAMICSFITGNTIQSNSVGDVLQSSFGVPPLVTGVVLATLAGAVILGGVKRIARVASALVPSMAAFYMLFGLFVVVKNAPEVPGALADIVRLAFTYEAAEGGFFGSALWLAIRFGVARGIFSNEAGQGSAAIAHAAARTKGPVDQGLVAMLGTFIDTLIVCTVTGLVIMTSGVLSGATSEMAGAPLTAAAFEKALPGGWGDGFVSIALVVFAFTTILGWSYYGERSAEYLFGEKGILPYRLVYVSAIFAGSAVLLLKEGGFADIVSLVWLLGDTTTALMATPNLIALALLSPVVFKLTRDYFAERK